MLSEKKGGIIRKLFIELGIDILNLLRSIRYELEKKSIYPNVLQLSITNKCNSRCIMCDIWKNQKIKDIAPEELCTILQDKAFSKIRSIGISGGEPTLRKDFSSIIDVIINNLKKLRSVTLLTNCVDEKKVSESIESAYDKCRNRNIKFTALLSLDGIGQIHDKNRGTKNNFRNFEKVKNYLEENKIPFGIGTTITPVNCYYIDDILEYCFVNNIKLFKFRLGVGIKRLFNQGYEKKYSFSKEQLFHITNFFQKLTGFLNTRNYIFYKSLFEELAYKKGRLAGCLWKDKGITLGSNGEISYCSVESPILGDAKQISAFKIYKNNINIRKKIIENCCDSCKHDLKGPLSFKKQFCVVLNKWAQYYSVFKKQIENQLKFVDYGSLIRNKNIYYPGKNSVKSWKKVLITGWWGTETAGDKAILGELLNFLKNINVNMEIYITSYNDYVIRETFKELQGKYKTTVPIDKISKQLINNVDAIIVGGGPLAEIYGIKYIRDAFLVANNKQIDRVIFGCGISPNLSNKYKRIISDLVRLSTKSFFRDKESYVLAQGYGIKGETGYACDPSIAYLDRLLKKNHLKQKKNIPYIVTLFRANTLEYVKGVSSEFLFKKNTKACNVFADVLNKLIKEKNIYCYLLPMHNLFVGGDDRIYNRKIAKKLNNKFILERAYLTLEELIKKIYNAELVISMRYHGHLFPFALEVPFLSIDYTYKNGKVMNFLKDINYFYSLSWEDIDENNIYGKLIDILNKQKEIIAKNKNEKVKLLKRLKSVYKKVFNVNIY